MARQRALLPPQRKTSSSVANANSGLVKPVYDALFDVAFARHGSLSLLLYRRGFECAGGRLYGARHHLPVGWIPAVGHGVYTAFVYCVCGALIYCVYTRVRLRARLIAGE